MFDMTKISKTWRH